MAITLKFSKTRRLISIKIKILYKKLKNTKGRVLSVSLHENGEVVATGGSDGTVRTYDVDTGKQKFYMTVQNNSKTRPLNWSVIFLKFFFLSFSLFIILFLYYYFLIYQGINGNKRDYTIVSVNSLGETEFWDGEVGVRSQCLKNNNSSVTCVVRSKVIPSFFTQFND